MDYIQGLFTAKDTPKEINVESKIRTLAFIPGERLRIVSGEESTIQIRYLENNLMGEPIEPSTGALAVAASRDGSRIVAGTTDGFAIWDGQNSRVVVRHAISAVRTLDISLDSKWVVTGSDARTADLWDISTGERRPGLGPLRHEYNVISVKFCPCGERLATATLYGSVRIFATSSGQKLFTIPVSVTTNLTVSNITFAWFAHCPQIFAVSQGQIKCLNTDDGTLIYQWPTRGVIRPASVILSPNNKLIAYTTNKSVVIRNTETREQVGETLKHEEDVSGISFSPRSDYLVVGADTKFTVWNLRKLLNDTSYFTDATTGPAESCARHKEDTTKKPPPTTFPLPLMSISNGAVKGWLHSFLDYAEQVFSTEIETSASTLDHNTFANRALIRGRLGNGDGALEDAEKSLQIQGSAIGQIAKVIARIHRKEFELAKQEIPVLQTYHSDKHTSLLEAIQSILFCLSGEYQRETSHIVRLSGDRKLLLLVQANMHLSEKQFDSALESFNKTGMSPIFPHEETREMWTIAFIFGWKFSGLSIQIQQKKCESLLDAGDSQAAVLFIEVRDTYQREIAMHVELSDWSSKFRRDCLEKLLNIGDKALATKNYAEAIKQYTAVEPLIGDLDARHDLFLKRSEAHAEMDPPNWKEALQDAEEAIKLNPISPWGYDRKHAVLYTRQYFREAAEALDEMIKSLTFSKDAKSTKLREQGVEPGQTRKHVIAVVDETLGQPRPHILINTESGRLCDKQKQTEAFKAHPQYKKLVLSPTSQVGPDGEWKEEVRKYFYYSTFSHTWEDTGEPEWRAVENRPVDSLPESIPNTKLQTFCKKTREHGYFWAWSDTCCINKAEREILDVSLRSMYRWYSGSSLTIVHLKGVLRQLETDLDNFLDILDELLKEFISCRWNKRAWTLQEYFASKVIHFYTEDWKLYLPIDVRPDANPINHKESRAIQRGMQLVTGLGAARLAALKPGTADVRQKLRLASRREATRKEDIAYSLLGIFRVTIEAIYGDDEVPRALGRLLGALLTQSADVSILAWTGKSSEYNTCLPAEITVYHALESLHIPNPIEEATLKISVSAMLSNMSEEQLKAAVKLHDRLLDVPPPELHHGRLKLPCILFQVTSVEDSQTPHLYTITVPPFGKVEIKTEDDLTSARNMYLVNPWFRTILDPGIPLSESVRRESALRLLAYLRQPFGAFLLAWTSRDYERIAADRLIRVQIPETVSMEQLMENTRVLYIR